MVELSAKNGLRGKRVYLDFPSVGATENIMMAATLAKGTTTIELSLIHIYSRVERPQSIARRTHQHGPG